MSKVKTTPFKNIQRNIAQIDIATPFTLMKNLDKKVVAIFILVPFCLTMIHYVGQFSWLCESLSNIGFKDFASKLNAYVKGSRTNNLGTLIYWGISTIVFYFIIPSLVIKFYFKESLADYGLQIKGAFKDFRLYIFMLFVMMPLVAHFSGTEAFQSRYPFLKTFHGELNTTDFMLWELMYCLQFFVLEFFFRGFVVLGLQPKFGVYAVFIMTIPYCMIHFGKPLPETLAAIIAGLVLGSLSMKSRSIWLGFLIHCSVGIAMDIASIWQKGNS